MIDASRFPFEENIARTRQVVELDRQYSTSFEGEIGIMAGVEDDLTINHGRAIDTTPEEAIEFQARSEV